jgi:hypothetical protein
MRGGNAKLIHAMSLPKALQARLPNLTISLYSAAVGSVGRCCTKYTGALLREAGAVSS